MTKLRKHSNMIYKRWWIGRKRYNIICRNSRYLLLIRARKGKAREYLLYEIGTPLETGITRFDFHELGGSAPALTAALQYLQ